MHAGGHSHAFEVCELVFLLNADIRLLFPFCLVPCTVLLLNAAVFADLALYLAVGGLASVELSCSLTTLVLQERLAPFPRLPILGAFHALFLSSSPARDLQHKTWRLSCCLLEVGRQQNLDFAASHRLGHLCLVSRCSLLRNFDLLLKLHHIEEFPRCPHFTWDIFLIELEMQILLLFSLKSHAPCATERQCLIPKAASLSCW